MQGRVRLGFVNLIRLENINVTLNGRRVLENISFGLEVGQVWAVRGRNGAGKSTFLKLLRGEVWPDHGAGARAFSIVSGEPRESPIGVRERVAFVSPEMQDRYVRLDLPVTGLEVVRTGFHQTDFLSYPLLDAQLERADRLIKDLRLEDLRDKPVGQMSKGQLRQILLARALVGAPRVLMLDEFFSGVDAASRTRLSEIVERLAHGGTPILYTTHRLEETLGCTTHELEIAHGRITRQGQVESRAASLEQSSPVSLETPRTPSGTPEIILEITDADVFLGRALDDATALDGSADGGFKHVLHGLNWTVQRGQHWVVVGHNGAGKSTLARLVRGELNPAVGGAITRFGLTQMPLWDIQRRVGLISNDVQVQHRLDAPGWVIVASGFGASLGWTRDLEPSEKTRVDELLGTLEIAHLARRSAMETSHGELKKLLIARALVTAPDIVILDEPFDYLDSRSRALLFRLVTRESAHSSFIVVAHRPEDIPPSATHLLALESGRIAYRGEIGTTEAQDWLSRLETSQV
jgi:molybdate transport system ATP-binding protein